MKVTLGERQLAGNTKAEDGKKSDEGLLGFSARALTAEERRNLKISDKEGVFVVDVDPDRAAAEADIRPGDIILRADRKAVNSPEALSKIVKDVGVKRGAIMLQIQRRGESLFRAVPIESEAK